MISLFPTSQVLVLPPARRNSPTGDLKAQEWRPCCWTTGGALEGRPQSRRAALPGPPRRKETAGHTCCHHFDQVQSLDRAAAGSWPDAHPALTQEPGPHLFGTAVKLENTYLAIISRHVSVSSKWRFFKLSSAWAIEFSSADPRLELVRDVWILLEGGAMARSGHWAGQIIYHGDQRWRHACAERAKPERPRQCTWPREPRLGQQSGHVTPERKCRS